MFRRSLGESLPSLRTTGTDRQASGSFADRLLSCPELIGSPQGKLPRITLHATNHHLPLFLKTDRKKRYASDVDWKRIQRFPFFWVNLLRCEYLLNKDIGLVTRFTPCIPECLCDRVPAAVVEKQPLAWQDKVGGWHTHPSLNNLYFIKVSETLGQQCIFNLNGLYRIWKRV